MTTESRGILGTIERIGNRLPDPVTLFLLGALLVLVVSQLGAMMEWTAVNPTNNEVVTVKPLLSGEGPPLRTDALVVLELETDQPLVPKGFEGRCAEASGAKRYGCAEKGLQEWVRENAWKRRGLLGRIGLFVPLE